MRSPILEKLSRVPNMAKATLEEEKAGSMHSARLAHSDRLQRVLAVLRSGQPMTTRQIVQEASVCAVNSIISELRANGILISCRHVKRGVFEYTLLGEKNHGTP